MLGACIPGSMQGSIFLDLNLVVFRSISAMISILALRVGRPGRKHGFGACGRGRGSGHKAEARVQPCLGGGFHLSPVTKAARHRARGLGWGARVGSKAQGRGQSAGKDERHGLGGPMRMRVGSEEGNLPGPQGSGPVLAKRRKPAPQDFDLKCTKTPPILSSVLLLHRGKTDPKAGIATRQHCTGATSG